CGGRSGDAPYLGVVRSRCLRPAREVAREAGGSPPPARGAPRGGAGGGPHPPVPSARGRRPAGRLFLDDHRHRPRRDPRRDRLRARRPGAGTLHRTTAPSPAMLSGAVRLQTVAATFDGDLGQFAAHGRVLGDTVLSIAIVSEGDSQMTRIPLQGPITLPTLLPLRLAFGGELRSGRSYTARLFDPLLLTGR